MTASLGVCREDGGRVLGDQGLHPGNRGLPESGGVRLHPDYRPDRRPGRVSEYHPEARVEDDETQKATKKVIQQTSKK